jgi:hypothetical protein
MDCVVPWLVDDIQATPCKTGEKRRRKARNKARVVVHDLAEHDPLLEYHPRECSMCGDTWCKCEDLNYR